MKLTLSSHALQDAVTMLRASGWPGVVGAVCLAIAAGAAAWWLPAMRRESAALAAAADAAEQRTRRIAQQRRTTTDAPVSSAQRFRAAFPSALDRQDRLAAMLALAAERQLEPRRSEFQLSLDRDLGLLRYTVTMPLSGPYDQVRDFIEAVHARDPALSLDRLRLRRASAGTSVVETDLTWSLYMRTGTAAPSPLLSASARP